MKLLRALGSNVKQACWLAVKITVSGLSIMVMSAGLALFMAMMGVVIAYVWVFGDD